jgi:hypothetical protein
VSTNPTSFHSEQKRQREDDLDSDLPWKINKESSIMKPGKSAASEPIEEMPVELNNESSYPIKKKNK